MLQVSIQRYRYTGKERDEENGFTYHGARYCAPWLGRWTAPDPAGMIDGPNLYAYVTNRPVIGTDPDGRVVWFVVAAVVIGTLTTSQHVNTPKKGGWTYRKSTGQLIFEDKWCLSIFPNRPKSSRNLCLPNLKTRRIT